MSTNTIVNGQTVVHKESDGVLTTSPDVCLTPMGATVVPIPYVNEVRSVDTSNGRRTGTRYTTPCTCSPVLHFV